MNESDAYFWLSLGMLGGVKLNRLLEESDPLSVWEKFYTEPFRRFFGDKHALLSRWRDEQKLADERRRLADQRIGVLTRDDPRFPVRLNQREVSPPAALYYTGDISLAGTDSIAVVGTRACSTQGAAAAAKLSAGLTAAGLTIVSGLATGIDSAALTASLDGGGRPISIMPGGLKRITPAGNAPLFRRIAEKGLLLSEIPPDAEAQKFSFHERNRLLSGLALGVLVVEAPKSSGALITANFAHEQGRELFALPGSILSPKTEGNNRLLRAGAAHFTMTAADVLNELGMRAPEEKRRAAGLDLNENERKVYDALADMGETSFDALCDACGMRAWELPPVLVKLEMDGLIVRLPANAYALKL